MYHAEHSHIITTDDIIKLRHFVLQEENGKLHAHIFAELRPDKEFNETDGQLRLHLTNGVSHRYLVAEPYPPYPEPEVEASTEEKTVAEENPDELTVAPATHAARKQNKKG